MLRVGRWDMPWQETDAMGERIECLKVVPKVVAWQEIRRDCP
jgi:hypothetical protein